MSDLVAGSHTNGTKEDETSPDREVKGHMLFEIATEVANRGRIQSTSLEQLLTAFLSWGYILRDKIESSCDDGRIWGQVHSYRPTQ